MMALLRSCVATVAVSHLHDSAAINSLRDFETVVAGLGFDALDASTELRRWEHIR